MTIIDAMPTLTRKKVKDLIPGDVIVSHDGKMHDMVTGVNQMPIDFGLDYGNLYVELNVQRSHMCLGVPRLVPGTYTVKPHTEYEVLTETGAQ